MAEEDIELLKRARENFVRKRRALAEQMIPAGAAAAHFGPNFADIQAAIEAIDRAIKDEQDLPEDYAMEEAEETSTDDTAGPERETSNVVDVDFDPA